MRFFGRDNVLYEKNTGDMTVQVLQRDDRRELCFGNHIIQSAVSVSNPDALQLDYTRAMMAAFVFAPQAANILHIGLGAGSLPRFIHLNFPRSNQRLVELSPVVVQVALRYFFLPVSPRLKVIQNDGEQFLTTCNDSFEMIFQDAFQADGVSRHLESVEYFKNILHHLTPGGWLVNNVWGSDRANLETVRLNLAAVFPQLYSLSVRSESNVIFFAGQSPSPMSKDRLMRTADTLSKTIGIDLVQMAQSIKTIRRSEDSNMRVSS